MSKRVSSDVFDISKSKDESNLGSAERSAKKAT